jgi:hypothetical protein
VKQLFSKCYWSIRVAVFVMIIQCNYLPFDFSLRPSGRNQ